MNALLIYSLKAALVLTLLYAPYTLLLQQEKFFRLNRMMLLGILLLSITLPLCNVSWLSLDQTPVVQAVQQQMVDIIHTSGRWKPAELNGQPVRMRMYMPITFDLENEHSFPLLSSTRRVRTKCSYRFYVR